MAVTLLHVHTSMSWSAVGRGSRSGRARGRGRPRAASIALGAALFVVAPLAGQAAGGTSRPPSAASDGAPVLRRLGLDEALREARRSNPDLREAELGRESARAAARAASAALLPGIELDAGFQRSNDPVFAFGTKLRQEHFGSADLALDALNRPAPLTDWTTGAGVRWSVLDPSNWARRAAARHGADAAGWQAERAREGAELQTRVLYWRAVGAEAGVRAAGAAVKAARATVGRFERRSQEGLLTRADVLRARAELASARADRTEAESQRDDVRSRLGLALGWSPDTVPVPTDTLTAPARDTTPASTTFDPRGRADVRALAALAEAGSAREDEALSTFAPRVEAFAGYQRHAASAFGNDGNAWNVGVMLHWTLFGGFGRPAALSRARAQEDAAELRLARSVREAEAEVQSARRGVRSALRSVAATQAAEQAASEARDLMRRRFEEGLVGATDLLSAEAAASAARSRAVRALAGYHEAMARWRFALGRDGGEKLP